VGLGLWAERGQGRELGDRLLRGIGIGKGGALNLDGSLYRCNVSANLMLAACPCWVCA